MALRTSLRLALLFGVGLFLGAAARLADLYTTNLGNIFSQMAIWILLGVMISLRSKTGRQAMGNVLVFCLGMLLTYYATAAATDGVYSSVFIVGWTIFAFCSPVLAWFVWMAKRPGLFSTLIRVGVVAVSVASSLILFDGFRIYDAFLNAALIYCLFFWKGGSKSAEAEEKMQKKR